jgi:hypothetical protein
MIGISGGWRVFPVIAAIVVGGGGVIAVSTGGPSAPPPATPSGDAANLWVDVNGGTCARQSAASAYGDAAACSSLNAAYSAASPGDVVAVKAGSYAAQDVTATNKISGPNITFRPATGETVSMTGLSVEASYGTYQDFDLNGADFMVGMEGGQTTHQAVANVTGLRLNGRELRIFSAQDVLVQDGDWGPIQPDGAAGGENNKLEVAAGVPGFTQVQRVTLDGNWFHDAQAADLVAHHIECIAIFSGQDITLTRNKFSNCSVEDVFVKDNGSGGTIGGTYRVENNWFGTARNTLSGGAANGEGLVFCTNPPTEIIVNNSFQSGGDFQPDSCSTYATSATVQGNYGYGLFNICSYPGATYTYNAWINRSACTGTGNIGSTSNVFVSDTAGNGFDLHITAGATSLLGQIPAASSLLGAPVDIDNDSRATFYDIGSDER